MTWQPIDTAPRDGTVFLAFNVNEQDKIIRFAFYEQWTEKDIEGMGIDWHEGIGQFETVWHGIRRRLEPICPTELQIVQEQWSSIGGYCGNEWKEERFKDYIGWTPTHWQKLPEPPENA